MTLDRRSFGLGLIALTGTALAASRRAVAAGAPDPRALAPGLVLPLSTDPQAWDTQTVSCPRVLRMGPRDFRMWYYGRDPSFDPAIRLPSGRIGLARSTDGIHWTRVRGPGVRGSVFDPSPDPARFDSAHVGVGDVQRDGAGFEMWYFGGDGATMELGGMRMRGFPLRIGRATSRDGLHWRRDAGPIRGAVLDVGAPGEPDAGSVGWPQVVKVRPDLWRMYYHTVGREIGFAICAAESTDQGRRWRRLGVLLGRGREGSFDVNGASTRQVFRFRDRYRMLYEGWNAERRPAIGLAESRDGIEWERVRGPLPDGAVLAPTPKDSGRWDCGAIGTPWLVELGGGRSLMYYVGREVAAAGESENDARYQIGLAVSDDPELLQWRRWEPG
jgi:hypothetical protein